MLAPMAIRKYVRKNVVTESTKLKSTNPSPVDAIPRRIMIRGPKRSIAHPWIGPSTPLSIRVIANASENVVLLHLNSSSRRST